MTRRGALDLTRVVSAGRSKLGRSKRARGDFLKTMRSRGAAKLSESRPPAAPRPPYYRDESGQIHVLL